MMTLHTMNGRARSNAIVRSIDNVAGVWNLESDFGNRYSLTAKEVAEQFTPGHFIDYVQWCRDREALTADRP